MCSCVYLHMVQSKFFKESFYKKIEKDCHTKATVHFHWPSDASFEKYSNSVKYVQIHNDTNLTVKQCLLSVNIFKETKHSLP